MRSRFCAQLPHVVLGSLALLMPSCRPARPTRPSLTGPRLPEVELTRLGRRDFQEFEDVQGFLGPIKTMTVVAPLASRVEISVPTGSKVRTGQVVARLDPRPTQQRVRAARAALAQAHSARQTTEQTLQRQRAEFDAARAQFRTAEMQLQEAREESNRAATALVAAREASKRPVVSPTERVSKTSRAPEAQLAQLASEVRSAEIRLQEALDSVRRRAAEHQAAEQRFVKSRELHEVGAISRNAFEADRNKAVEARGRQQEAQAAADQAGRVVSDARTHLEEARLEAAKLETVRESRENVAARPPAVATAETVTARARIEDTARMITRAAAALAQAQQKMAEAQSALHELEPRLQGDREAEQRAQEELANLSALLVACKLRSPADGVVTTRTAAGTATKPGDVVIGVSDLSGVRFTPDRHWLPPATVPVRITLIANQREFFVEVFPERHVLHGTTLRIGSGSSKLPTAGAASVRWPTVERRNRPAVEAGTLVPEGNARYVFVARFPGQNCKEASADCGIRPGGEVDVERSLVTLRGSNGDWREVESIASGPASGDFVVARPSPAWPPKLRVRVQRLRTAR